MSNLTPWFTYDPEGTPPWCICPLWELALVYVTRDILINDPQFILFTLRDTGTYTPLMVNSPVSGLI